MKNLSGSVAVKPSLIPKSVTAAATGLGVDRRGYERAILVVHLGAHDRTTGDETITVTVEESADDSTYTAIAGATTGAIGDVVPNATSGNVYLIDIDLSKPARLRYLRAKTAVAGTTPVDVISATFLLSNPRYLPPTQDATVVSV